MRCSTATRRRGRVVVPTHYDDFFKPLGDKLGFIRKVRLETVPDEIHAVSRDATIAALPRADWAMVRT